MWYLGAIIYTYFIILIFRKKIFSWKNKLVCIFGALFVFLQYWGTKHTICVFGTEVKASVLAMNGLIEGTFFALVGICVASFTLQEEKKRLCLKQLWIGIMVSFLFSVVERKICMIVGISIDVHFSSIFAVIFILQLVKLDERKIPILSYIGQYLSRYIYYWHILIASILAHGTRNLDVRFSETFKVIFLSVIVAYVFSNINNFVIKNKCKKIKKGIS